MCDRRGPWVAFSISKVSEITRFTFVEALHNKKYANQRTVGGQNKKKEKSQLD